MANSGFSIGVDFKALAAALGKLPQGLEQRLMDVAEITAKNIQREAQRRVRRRTGATMEGILVREDYWKKGWIVVTQDVVPEEETERRRRVGMRRAAKSHMFRVPHTWLYLEEGTIQGEWPSHTLPKRPFFYPSVELEQGPYQRRTLEAIETAIEDAGLGE